MAEAIGALSLAANIVQFIDFGGKVLSGSLKLHKNGWLSETNDTKIITKSLQQSIEMLNQPLKQSDSTSEVKISQTEADLRNLATHCIEIANELIRAITKVELQGKRGKWDSFQAALKHVLAEEKIEKIRQRLDNFRQEIIVHILACFRTETNNALKQQDLVLNTIQGRTESIGETFLKFVEQSNKWQEGYIEDCRRWKREIIDAIHSSGSSEEQRPKAIGVLEGDIQKKLLALLEFEEMEDRHERIAEAFEKTFQWIFMDPNSKSWDESWSYNRGEAPGESPQGARWISFTQWLASSSSLYWITGKAGSGKSTLIKYIAQDQRTLEYLKRWTPAGKIVTASYFFWNSGTSMQMSQQGFLQSLLHQILSSCPALTCSLLPQRWEAYCLFGDDPNPLTELELRQAFTLLKKVEPSAAKFCLFVDGLDEFDGDHSKLVEFIKDLSEYPNVKLCVSSRPWLVFEDAFKRRPSLMVQDLTYPDIMHFITSKFSGNPGFIELRERETEYADQLFKDIAQKSAGVFLWVALVVSSLLDGLSNGDRVSDLQRRLSFLPPDLEKLYQKILDNLDPFYLEHASQLFELVREAQEPPSILCMSFADEGLDSVLKQKIAPFDGEEINTRVNVMKRRLNSRCKGLLEVAPELEHPDGLLLLSSDPYSLSASTVQYLHRTVKDFLENSKNWEWFMKSRQEDYDPNLALAKSFLGQLKGVTSTASKGVSLVERCLFYAKLAQDRRPADIVAMLDELDRTAGELASRIDDSVSLVQNNISATNQGRYNKISRNKSCISLRNWTSNPYIAPRIKPHGLSFLSLTTRLGFHEYVAAKVKKGCLVIQYGNIWPLLLDAILPIECEEPLALLNPSLDKRMVKVLLDQGADPNRGIPYIPYSNMTPWEYFLWRVQNDSLKSSLDPWLEVVPQFLAYGADPCAITNSRFRYYDFIDSSKLARKGGDQVGDALYNYLQSTNRLFNWGLSFSLRCHFSAMEIEIIKEAYAAKRPSNPNHGMLK
ncbi:hypothetical protein N431DRAFT_411184 [Stipitochalara longipes BDJ]|nr:hypothetical protein N431DRAFT_411184 [Stipitochalara longipes BDJ]